MEIRGKHYRTFDEVTEEYYAKHPEEIEDFLKESFEEYARDGYTPALLTSLRMVARIRGISSLAEQSGITRNGIQKALSENAKPGFETVNTIIRAMGYGITLQKIEHRAG